MKNICFCVIYNHNYEKNIDHIKNIYKNRFTNLFQLMPFYTGNDKSVIGVYDNSYEFAGFITQAREKIYNPNFSHYVFIADDCFLNPNINENNILTELKLDDDSAFIYDLSLITNNDLRRWPRCRSNIIKLNIKKHLKYECFKFLPSINDARKYIELHGIDYKLGYTLNYVSKSLFNNSNDFGYPSLKAPFWSDFIIIPKESFKKFNYYCGVFSSGNIFVEITIPTSMIFTCPKIVTYRDINYKERIHISSFKYLKSCNYELSNVISNFPKDVLSYHPIKLSKLKYD